MKHSAFFGNPRFQLNSHEMDEWQRAQESTMSTFPVSAHVDPTTIDSTSEHRPNVSLSYMSLALPNGRPAVMLDIGSVGNIAGSRWIEMVMKYAADHGFKAQMRKRLKPLTASGVGHGRQQAVVDYRVPCAFLTGEGTDPTDRSRSQSAIHASLDMPSLLDSDTPGLMGLLAIRNYSGIVDTRNVKLYVNTKGDAEFDLPKFLPAGYKEIQCHSLLQGT